MTSNFPFPDRHDQFRSFDNLDLTVPDATRLPDLIWESLQRQFETKPNRHDGCDSALAAWVATSCFSWVPRNDLIDILPKALPFADPQQRKTLELVQAMLKGWNEAELRSARESLRLADKCDLWKMTVRELKALAGGLLRRGIGNRLEMRRLAIYTGSRILKQEAIEGIWKALSSPTRTAESEPPTE